MVKNQIPKKEDVEFPDWNLEFIIWNLFNQYASEFRYVFKRHSGTANYSS